MKQALVHTLRLPMLEKYHMLQRRTGGTFSTSPSPRRQWLTVCRGPEVCYFDRSFYCGAACYSEEAQKICFEGFRTRSRISWMPKSRKIAIFGTSILRFVGVAQSSYRTHFDQRSILGFQCSNFENAKFSMKHIFLLDKVYPR